MMRLVLALCLAALASASVGAPGAVVYNCVPNGKFFDAQFNFNQMLAKNALVDNVDAAGNAKAKAGLYNPENGAVVAAGTAIAAKALDLCKVDPAFCAGAGPKGAHGPYCQLPALAKVCCPNNGAKGALGKNLGNGCPAGVQVQGMPRSFMPQIIDAGVFAGFLTNALGKAVKLNAVAQVDINQLAPTQDQIQALKTAGIACGIANGNNPPATYVCQSHVNPAEFDVIDGHHRWSAWKMAARFGGKGLNFVGAAKVPNQMPIQEFTAACTDIITQVQQLVDWTTLAKGAKDLDSLPHAGIPKGKENQIQFSPLFMELDSRFGRRAHSNAQVAAQAYVEQTRERLHDAGIELKGGDEALMSHWKARHENRLWGRNKVLNALQP